MQTYKTNLQNIKCITWNVNSLNKRYDQLLKLIEDENPDILMIQETKTISHDFYGIKDKYFIYDRLQSGGNNGVVIFSKFRCYECPPLSVYSKIARFIDLMVDVNGKPTHIICVYVPYGESNKQPSYYRYKIYFLNQIYKRILHYVKQDKNIIIGGDWNIAPTEKDHHTGVRQDISPLTKVEGRFILFKFYALNLKDFYDSENLKLSHHFTQWAYFNPINNLYGYRLDYFLTNLRIIDKKNLLQYRFFENPSDHIPVITNLKF